MPNVPSPRLSLGFVVSHFVDAVRDNNALTLRFHTPFGGETVVLAVTIPEDAESSLVSALTENPGER